MKKSKSKRAAKRSLRSRTTRLYRVILPVRDIDKAAAFYSKVLRTPGERVSPGRHYFDCGGTILSCYSPKGDGDPVGEGWRFHPNQYIYFAVPNLAAAFKRVPAGGGKPERPIVKTPWGERMFWAKDPFGNPISFVQESTVFTGWRRTH